MSTGTTEKAGKSTRLAAAEKVRAVEWLVTRPKPIEAETMVAAANAVSDALGIKLTAAVLQDILDASPSLAAKVVIGGGGAVAHLTAVVDAVSLRVDTVARTLEDFDLRLKSAVAHQDQFDHQVADSLNTMQNHINRLTALVKSMQAAVDSDPRPAGEPAEANGENDQLPGFEDSANGSGSTVPS